MRKPDQDERNNAMLQAQREHPQLRDFAQYRASVKDQPYVPAYHFYGPYPFRINDPNGLCQWQGLYHLFYQQFHTGKQAHWGHMVSKDMVRWRDLPTAIGPGPEAQVYSGSALAEEGRVLAMYHGTTVGNMIAQAEDPLLLSWEKLGGKPVIPIAETDANGHPYRVFDPFLWKEPEGYYALSGSFWGEAKRYQGLHTMAIHLFFSQDLLRWTYLGPLMEDNPFTGVGNDGACPYFWPLGDRHMLLFFSHTTGPHCLIGRYDRIRHRFAPEQHVPLAAGPVGRGGLHAPCAMPDGEGGCFVVFNLKDAYPTLQRQGAMSLMRHFTLGPDGRLRQRPIRQLESLRLERLYHGRPTLKAFEPWQAPAASRQMELSIRFDPGRARALSIRVLTAPDGGAYTEILANWHPHTDGRHLYLTLDATRASRLPGAVGRCPETLEVILPAEEPLALRVFVDRCMVEVFACDRLAIAQMVYPDMADWGGVWLEALGAPIEAETFDLWQLDAIDSANEKDGRA